MNKIELAILYFFHTLNGVGNRTLWKIKNDFGSFQSCFEADSRSLNRSSLPLQIQSAIIESRRDVNPPALLDKVAADGIRICCVEDNDYPELLNSIFDPPYLFYYRGDLGVLNQFCFGVVGSRAATNYGKIQARRFGNELARQGMVVVSGMARGIDTEAHQGALEANGKTAAVLGSGLNIVYPPENKQIYNSICQNGIVLSEFPPDMHPEPGNFPVRNRTISGLCHGVLVVEAKQRSGALITADFALEQGRDVFAIPGPINSKNSEGTNALIKQGACLVSSIEDILNEYSLNQGNDSLGTHQGELLFDLDNEELSILESLGHEAVHFDALMGSTQMSNGMLSTILLKMELKGIIRAMPGNYYLKI